MRRDKSVRRSENLHLKSRAYQQRWVMQAGKSEGAPSVFSAVRAGACSPFPFLSFCISSPSTKAMHVSSVAKSRRLFPTPWTVAHQVPLFMGFPSKNTGVGCHSLLQGVFPTQGSNLCLLHWQVDSLPLSDWEALYLYIPFSFLPDHLKVSCRHWCFMPKYLSMPLLQTST